MQEHLYVPSNSCASSDKSSPACSVPLSCITELAALHEGKPPDFPKGIFRFAVLALGMPVFIGEKADTHPYAASRKIMPSPDVSNQQPDRRLTPSPRIVWVLRQHQKMSVRVLPSNRWISLLNESFMIFSGVCSGIQLSIFSFFAGFALKIKQDAILFCIAIIFLYSI